MRALQRDGQPLVVGRAASRQERPSIGQEKLAGNAPGQVAAQEHGQAGQLVVLDHAPQRGGSHQGRYAFLGEGGGHRFREGGPWGDGVHPDLFGAQLDGHGGHQVVHRCLGRCIGRVVGRRTGGLSGRHEQDGSPARPGHHRRFGPPAQCSLDQVLADDVPPVVASVFHERPGSLSRGEHPDVVDGQVQAA